MMERCTGKRSSTKFVYWVSPSKLLQFMVHDGQVCSVKMRPTSGSHIHCFSGILCYICVFRTSRFFRRSLRSIYFMPLNTVLSALNVYSLIQLPVLSLRSDVVVSWYRVIKGHKGEAILVWVNFRLDLRVRDFKLLMLNFCCALGQTSSGVAYYPVLTATTSLTPHGVRGNKSADILRTPPIISEITALVCMTSRDLEYPCRSCILLNITYKCGSRAVFVLFNLKNSLEYGFPTGHQ